jgi:urease accessory protein
MEADSKRMRGTRPFIFSNLKAKEGVQGIVDFILETGGVRKSA